MDKELLEKTVTELYGAIAKIESIQNEFLIKKQDIALSLSSSYVAYRDALFIPKVDGTILDPLDSQLRSEYNAYKQVILTLEELSQCSATLSNVVDSMKLHSENNH